MAELVDDAVDGSVRPVREVEPGGDGLAEEAVEGDGSFGRGEEVEFEPEEFGDGLGTGEDFEQQRVVAERCSDGDLRSAWENVGMAGPPGGRGARWQ